MKRLAIWLVLALPLMGARTRIMQTMYTAPGVLAQGYCELTWPAYTTAAGEVVVADRTTVYVTAGRLDVSLYPTEGATPSGVTITARCKYRGGVETTDYWSVPVSTPAVGLDRVITQGSLPISLNQLMAGGATDAQCMIYTAATGLWGPANCTAGGANATQIQGRGVASTAPTDAQTLMWNAAGATWQPGDVAGGGSVTSVFGRAGAVAAASGDYTTAQITELTNLYHTSARVWAILSATSPVTHNGSGQFACPTCITTSTSPSSGDLSGTMPNLTVATVGGSTAANIHAGELLANAATSANTASAIVRRDPSGNFIAGTITAALTGNASTATAAAALSGSPSQCSGGQFAVGIAANGNAQCSTPSGAGDVVGPSSATSGNIAVFSGATGKVIADGARALPAGTVVGTSDTQTLTGKTLTDASNHISGTVIDSGTVAAARVATLNQNTTGTAAGLAAQYIDWSAASGGASIANKPTLLGYPGAGVPDSTGSAWGTSYTVGTGASNLVQLNASSQLPAVSAALLTNFPTFNQNTTGTAAGITGKTFVGTATQIPLLSGTPAGTKCVHTDANGNLTEAAADCGSGSGGGGSKDLSIDAPSTVDTNKYQLTFPAAVTLSRVHCSTDQGTVSINLDVRAIATPNTPGTDVLSAALACDNDSQSSCASGCDVNTIAAGSVAAHVPVNLQITATGSSPNVVRIHVEAQ